MEALRIHFFPAFFFVGFERGIHSGWLLEDKMYIYICIFSQKNHQTCGYFTTAPQTDKLGEYKKMDVGQKLVSRCLDRVNEHPNLVTHSILFIFLGCSPGCPEVLSGILWRFGNQGHSP